MDNKVKTVEQWIVESDGVIFRYQVYRKIYTPYEQQNASILESQFESVMLPPFSLLFTSVFSYGETRPISFSESP